MSRKDLAARWETPEGKVRRATVLDAVLSGGRMSADLGLGEHEGRWDLRGISLGDDASKWEMAGLLKPLWKLLGGGGAVSPRWEKIDFSYAKLVGLNLREAFIEDSVFDEADCSRWGLWKCEIHRCRFKGTDMRGAALGTGSRLTGGKGEGNTWVEVVFEGADMRDAVLDGTKFIRCAFSHLRANGIQFNQCDLHGSRFLGPLKDVVFDCRGLDGEPTRLREVDFSGATFSEVAFRGCLLSEVRLPTQPDLEMFGSSIDVMRKALQLISGQHSPEAEILRRVLENECRGESGRGADTVENWQDYRAWGGSALEDLARETWGRAAAAVGAG
jgi:uncharacterized protein YjbI with pentapeptide repeats